MDQVTQQNAALVEQAAAAAQSMDDQAGKLKASAAIFKLPHSVNRSFLERRIQGARKVFFLPCPFAVSVGVIQ
jgi:hypothetical protein